MFICKTRKKGEQRCSSSISYCCSSSIISSSRIETLSIGAKQITKLLPHKHTKNHPKEEVKVVQGARRVHQLQAYFVILKSLISPTCSFEL